MELKPKPPTFRSTMLGLATFFGMFAAAKLFIADDLYTGLWSFAVCFALVLGILPPWLTGRTAREHKAKPEKYNLYPQ
jgi:hypothetical protein